MFKTKNLNAKKRRKIIGNMLFFIMSIVAIIIILYVVYIYSVN